MVIGKVTFSPQIMAGVGVGNMTKQIFGTTVLYGVNSSIETFIPQAIGGGSLELVGIYLNQGRAILVLWYLPLALILCQTETILVHIGQDKEVAKYA